MFIETYSFLSSNTTHLVMQHASREVLRFNILELKDFEIFKIKHSILLIELLNYLYCLYSSRIYI